MTLPLLSETRAGIAVSRIARAAAPGLVEVSKAARELIAVWKKVAEEAGVTSRAAVSSVAERPMTRAAALDEVAAAATAAAAPVAIAAPRGLPAAIPSLKLQRLPSFTLAQLPPLRAKVAAKFRELFQKTLAQSSSVLAESASRSSSSSGGGGGGGGGGGRAVACSSSSSTVAGAASSSLIPPLRRLTAAAAATLCEHAACALETAVHEATRAALRPDAAYAERFRALALGLNDNPALTLNIVRGLHDYAWVAALDADALMGEEQRSAAAATRRAYEESVQLDWKIQHRKEVMASLGYNVDEGMFACPSCASKNTDFYEMQILSADEPTTKFAQVR
jgi:DNA-directed RNA polymerase subunit M/transcription elongation factor TFIIS